MEYRYLGKTGLKVSALSFGSWVTFGPQLDEDLALACMTAAREAGVNFFDNAEVYANGESEKLMGKALAKSGWRREDLVISTKLFWGGDGPNDRGLSRKHIMEGICASLDRMELDYVDLLFCHRPDFHTPLEETVRAMSNVVDQGMAFYWGTSEWTAERIREAWEIARREHLNPPVMEQPQYHMLWRDRVEKEYLRLYDEIGMGTTIWSPLASGLLTGKYNDGIPDDSRLALPGYEWLQKSLEGEEGAKKIATVKKLMPVAKDLGCTMAQLALAWCLKFRGVSTVITGASRPEQVTENMKALALAEKLDAKVMERIEGILDNRPAPEQDWR